MIEGTQKQLYGNVVTLVGSMRYYDQMLEAGSKLSQDGWIVIHPFRDPNADNLTAEKAAMYDAKIRESIDKSDAVFVVNVNRYIGKSTSSEIAYAVEHGKHVMYLEQLDIPEKKTPIITLIGSSRFKEQFDMLEEILISRGCIVFTPAIFKFNPDWLTPILHQTLDSLHREKMLMSDEIIVVNYDGYIGDNTREEIEYAEANGLTVKYLNQPDNDDNINYTDDHSSSGTFINPAVRQRFYVGDRVRIVAGGFIGQTGVINRFRKEASFGSTEQYVVEIKDPKESLNNNHPMEPIEGKDLVPLESTGYTIADDGIDRTGWLHYMVYQVLPVYQYNIGTEVQITEGDHRGKIGIITDCGRIFDTDHYANFYRVKVQISSSEVESDCKYESYDVAERIILPVTITEDN